MSTDIWIALIGLGGIIWTSTVGYFLARLRRRNIETTTEISKYKKEAKFERKAISTFVDLQKWDSINAKLQNFCAETGIDRFLILVAVNGATDPREVTAVYQYRPNSKDFTSYVGVQLDRDYVDKINYLKSNSSMDIDVNSLNNSLIKEIYHSEGVSYAVWHMLGTMPSPDTGQVAYKYCSFATHSGVISEETKKKINNLVGELKKIIAYQAY